MTVTDVTLWERARSGDAEAFGSLYERHANAVYAYCFRRTGDWARADECTSVVFLETWRKRQRFSLRGDSLLPWLLGVATNIMRNQDRSMRRFRHALTRLPPLEFERDFVDDLTDRIDAQDRVRTVLDEVRRLPDAEQDILALCVWQGLSSREAAEALGVAEGTVRTRLMRLRARLRQTIDGADESSHFVSSGRASS